uniref:Uncharacterized protein n=1 Tax=Brassica oleracea var. oleracea TaxID=109376 RepID=A0A0D3D3P7_BRAOL
MSSSFSFPRPTTKTDDLEDRYKVYRVDRTVVLDLAGTTETPETVREGYCGAYLSFFHSCGLNFPIPEPILEILAELGLSFTQILPNFLRYLVAFLVRAREEDLSFGLGEFRHLDWWIERQLANSISLDFLGVGLRISVTPSGSSLMSDEIRGLIGVLRRGLSNWSSFDQTRIRAAFAMPEGTNRASLVGGSEDEAEQSQEVIATPSVQAQSSDRLARQLVRRSSFRTSGSASRNRAFDETTAATRKRRRSSKGALPGPSRPRLVPKGDGSLFAAQGYLISLAGRMRSAGCRLPSLASSSEKEAYAKVAVASSKVMEAFNEYVVGMEDHVEASRNDKEIECIGSEIKRLSEELEATKREGKKDAKKTEALTEDWRRIHQENEALMTQVVAQKAKITAVEVERDQNIRRASRIVRRDIAKRYQDVLESLREKWVNKKKEVSAEIQLHELIANIDLLNELKDGGLSVDAELARLKEMEGD